ncbi:acyltransferase family protein [Negadavirga shengliensis]|uniref:Acyltransferase family protein n=1 Tax=Negadavirga shengliensis TaxID=1389218 RepID=A0ABV9T5A8_9BACT
MAALTVKEKTTKNVERYLSIDVLRGLTVALMIVVNTPGSWSTNYAPFLHAPWHGWTITDLVFPSFLFVVGNAMSFSMKNLMVQDKKPFLSKVMKRTLVIFLIGLLLAAYPFFRMGDTGMVPFDFTKIRIMGVLQRIAVCYAISAFVLYFLNKRGAIVFSVIALVGYWMVMYIYGETGDPYSLVGNAARRLDLFLIGAENLYRGEGIPFDPEGLLSTFPATVNVIAGFLVGDFIQKSGNRIRTIALLIGVGTGLFLLGSLWDIWFPINKKIWTSSFVLVTVGISTVCIALLMYVIEIMKLKKWAYFFEVFGKNPLMLYVLSGVFVKTMLVIRIEGQASKSWLYERFFVPYFAPNNASLLFAVGFMLVIWLIGYWMDKKRIYIKV